MCIRDSGKAGEVTAAIAKGVESAKKNLVKVPVLKGTVPHEQSARFGGAEVFIKLASHGTCVVAGGAMPVSYTHLTPKRHLAEFKEFGTDLNLGDTITVEMFNDANFVDVVAKHHSNLKNSSNVSEKSHSKPRSNFYSGLDGMEMAA